MKKLEDYSREELYNLTDDEVQELINKECMRNGVQLLPDVPARPTEPEKPRFDDLDMITVYEVADLVFTDKDIYEKVSQLINGDLKKVDYEWNLDSSYKYLDGEKDYYTQDTYNVYSKEDFENVIRPALEEWKEKQEKFSDRLEKWKETKNRYDEIKQERNSVADEVWEKVSEARRYYRKQDNYVRYFKEYLIMADFDFETAYRFYSKAYPDADLYFDDVEEQLNNFYSEMIEAENAETVEEK